MSNPKVYVNQRFCNGSQFDTVLYHTSEHCYNTEETDLESRYRSWTYTQFENQRKCEKCQQREDNERQERERKADEQRIQELNKALL